MTFCRLDGAVACINNFEVKFIIHTRITSDYEKVFRPKHTLARQQVYFLMNFMSQGHLEHPVFLEYQYLSAMP